MAKGQKDGRTTKALSLRTTTANCASGTPGQLLKQLHGIITQSEQGVTWALPGHTLSFPPEPGLPGGGVGEGPEGWGEGRGGPGKGKGRIENLGGRGGPRTAG